MSEEQLMALIQVLEGIRNELAIMNNEGVIVVLSSGSGDN